MDKKIILGFKILSYLFIALAVLLQILVLTHGDVLNKDNMIGAIASPILNNYLLLTFVTLGIAVVLAIGFPLVHTLSNPKAALKGLAYLAGLIVIGFIAYLLAGNSFSEVDLTRLKTTADISKIVGASIYFTYFVGGAAVLAIIYASISSALK